MTRTAARVSRCLPMPPERSNHDRISAPQRFRQLPCARRNILVALFITVRKVARSRDFYSRVLGGTVILDSGTRAQ